MQITPANLAALNTRYNNIFQESFLQQEIYWNKVCTLVNSDGESETHFWLDRIPGLREWIGDRQVNGAALLSYVLANKAYELTEGLDRFKVEDNRYRAFDNVVRQMAEQSKKWPDQLVFGSTGILASGQSTVTYDGQGFFSTAHPVNVNNAAQGTQSNYSASGLALTPANYNTVRKTMRGYKGADGLPLKVLPNLLIVGPDLETAGIQILKEQWLAPTGTTGVGAANTLQPNPFYGTADLLVVDDLAWQTGTWWMCDVRGAVKPFMFQLRQAAEFVYKTRPEDPSVFERHEFQYGVSTRGAAGYGPWFKAYKASA
jgi:phage major head subunit gpT-like protein